MRRIPVDFAPPRRLPARAWLAAACLLLAVAAWQGALAWRMSVRDDAQSARVAALQSRLDRLLQARGEAAARRAVAPPYARDAQALAALAAFPLDRVLAALESVQIVGVKLAQLEAAPADGSVTVQLEFTDQQALLHYLEAVNDAEPRPRWSLVEARMAGGAGGLNTATLASKWP